jgi:predicted  nucleic acid-binding Zn-ribbon protein
MSRDELRACMQLKDRNEAGAADIAQRQERMKNERDALADAPDSAAAARARLEPQLKAVEQADALVREHGKAVQDWNERMADFESKSKDMRNADRRRIVLKQERAALEAAEQPLVADRNEKVAAYERAVKDVNDKIGQHAARSSDWNKRNEELAAAEDRLNDARHKWTAECGDRRFREEDEIAIKAGK